jgi:hypothetical protein
MLDACSARLRLVPLFGQRKQKAVCSRARLCQRSGRKRSVLESPISMSSEAMLGRLAMRTWTIGPMVGLAAVMAFSLGAGAGAAAQQTAPAPARQQGQQGVDQRPPSVYQKLGSDTGGPAPKRELTGVWAGPFGERVGTPMVIPPLTPALNLYGWA